MWSGVFPRSDAAELMDDPAVDDAVLARTLSEIEGLNRWLAGYRPTLGGLEGLVPTDAATLSVLDVGVGSGDGARRMVDWGEARGVAVRVLGIDLSPAAAHHANQRCAGYPSIRAEARDLFEMPRAPSYDVVHASQVLHHFPGSEASRALRHMLGLSRLGVVINDLHRHPVPWAFIRGVTRLGTTNPLIRYDAPLSVRRGFVKAELERIAEVAGARHVEVTWSPLFRWQAVLRP